MKPTACISMFSCSYKFWFQGCRRNCVFKLGFKWMIKPFGFFHDTEFSMFNNKCQEHCDLHYHHPQLYLYHIIWIKFHHALKQPNKQSYFNSHYTICVIIKIIVNDNGKNNIFPNVKNCSSWIDLVDNNPHGHGKLCFTTIKEILFPLFWSPFANLQDSLTLLLR